MFYKLRKYTTNAVRETVPGICEKYHLCVSQLGSRGTPIRYPVRQPSQCFRGKLLYFNQLPAVLMCTALDGTPVLE